MPPSAREDRRLLLQVLRALRDWDQRQLAAAAGVSQGTVSRYEMGDLQPPPEVLERLTAAVGLPLAWVERRLLPILRAARERATTAAAGSTAGGLAGAPVSTPPPGVALEREARDADTLETALREVVAVVVEEFEADGDAPARRRRAPGRRGTSRRARDRDRGASPSPRDDRIEAARAWERLAPCTAAERSWLVERCAEFHSWALAELLCHESARLAAQDAAAALDLARLAVVVARLAPGGERWRRRLLGYARAFVANALRVAGNLPAAEAELNAAWNLWRAGAAGDPAALLPEWRLLDLEASLRRDTRDFQAALAFLDRAAAAAPPSAVGRILLKRAFTLEQSGDVAAAVAVLRQAAPRVAAGDEPRLSWVLEFNLCVNLCHLRHFEAVEQQLPRLRQLALDLGNDLDLVRVVWLSARTAAGSGRRAEACGAFEQVRKEWVARNDAFGTAMVSLELAQLYLEEGRTAEVRDLAVAMAWVLAAEGLERETLAALRLFHDAARRQTATLDQARRVLGLLERRPTSLLPTAAT